MVVIFSLLHLVTMGQAELTNDEAQYALYGYYLDWSYFDHPPLVGWLNAFILPFSDSDFALRIWPLLLAALSSFLLYGFSKELFPTESPWLATVAVLLYQASLISQVFGLAMLPDTPLIPIAIAALWTLFRVLKNNQQHQWLYVGLFFGLAGLAKYTAITLVATAIIALIIFKAQKILFTKWPWLAIFVAVLVISPILYWNMQHDWISISYQLNHGAPNVSWQIKNALISQASQLLTFSPAVYVLSLLAVFSSLKNETTITEKYLLASALPVLILFAWMSGYQQTLPHWTALGWIVLTPLSAKWLLHHWYNKSVRIFSYFGFAYSFIVILVFHLLLATALMPFEDNKHPLEDIYGWKNVAEHAVSLQQENKNTNSVIFIGNWSQFARLAWYAKPTPVQVTDQRFGQSDIWYGSAKKGSNGILVVPPKYKNSSANGKNKFARCDFKENVSQMLNNKIAATYQLYQCYGFKG